MEGLKKQSSWICKKGQGEWNKKMLSNNKTAWQVANKVQKNKGSKGGPPSKLWINGNICTNKKTLANHMNSFFTNKVTNNRTAIHSQVPSYNPINFLEENMNIDPPQMTHSEKSQ